MVAARRCFYLSTLLLVFAALVACAGPAIAVKSGTGEIRHDIDPLVARFPQLAAAVSVDWMSGTYGDSPGPSTYWIDAIAVLPADSYRELKDAHVLSADGVLASDFSPALSQGLQDLELYSSDALDAEFSSSRIYSKVFLDDANLAVILTSVLE